MTRTFYVEPATGAPVHRIDDRFQELVYDDIRVPAFVGNIHYTDAQVDQNVSDVKTKATLLGGTRVLYPVILCCSARCCSVSAWSSTGASRTTRPTSPRGQALGHRLGI